MKKILILAAILFVGCAPQPVPPKATYDTTFVTDIQRVYIPSMSSEIAEFKVNGTRCISIYNVGIQCDFSGDTIK